MKNIIKESNQIIHAFDEAVYNECIDQRTDSFHLKVTEHGPGQVLQVTSYTQNPEIGFCQAGCFIQKLDPYNTDLCGYSNAAEPVVSCIILLTFNCFFVQHFLIPSIIAHTTIPYEIIIVYNGVATDLAAFKKFRLIQSETGCVSKAYNIGVAAANGQFISIFHDDCLITSHEWHRPMEAALNAGAFAASTESIYNPHFDLEFLKGTPLFMSKANYQLIGGHDEFFFAGIEDLDFSYRILLKGYAIKKILMPYRHFNGMSTVILLSDNTELMRILFGYCLIPENTIEKFKTRYMGSPETQAMMLAVHSENLNYFIDKRALPANSKKLINLQLLTYDQYPALFNIRNTYHEWLLKQFPSDQLI